MKYDKNVLRKVLTGLTKEQIDNYFKYQKFIRLALKHYKVVEQYEKSKKLSSEYLNKSKKLEKDFALVKNNITSNENKILNEYSNKITELKKEMDNFTDDIKKYEK